MLAELAVLWCVLAVLVLMIRAVAVTAAAVALALCLHALLCLALYSHHALALCLHAPSEARQLLLLPSLLLLRVPLCTE